MLYKSLVTLEIIIKNYIYIGYAQLSIHFTIYQLASSQVSYS